MSDNEGYGTPVVLRVWLWAMPIAMLVASIVFGVIAAADSRWGLMSVMILMATLAVGLLVFHWWILYRFPKSGGRQQ